MSPSSRGRGLKSSSLQDFFNVVNVALFTRAWIEINHQPFFWLLFWSPSSRGRGLKYYAFTVLGKQLSVALFTRAWIEISLFENKASWNNVALFTRAWIEILSPTHLSRVGRLVDYNIKCNTKKYGHHTHFRVKRNYHKTKGTEVEYEVLYTFYTI